MAKQIGANARQGGLLESEVSAARIIADHSRALCQERSSGENPSLPEPRQIAAPCGRYRAVKTQTAVIALASSVCAGHSARDLMDAMSEFDARDRNRRIGKRLEAFHGIVSQLDRSIRMRGERPPKERLDR